MPIAGIQKYCGMPYEVAAKVQLLKFKIEANCVYLLAFHAS